MTTYTRLIEEKRENIQYMITAGFNFTEIGKAVSKDRTTIRDEILRNRYIKSTFFEMFDKEGIKKAVYDCDKLKKKPYVCNPCSKKSFCNKHKLYYNSKIAQKRYDETKSKAREGVDIEPDVIEEIELAIVPLIKKQKQSINQVYANHSDILYFAKSTFYKYVNSGVLSLTNLDLPKKVKYKARKKKRKENNKRELAILNKRTYKEYLDFTLKHPKMNIMQMDTVEGTKSSSKVLLTLIIKKTRFMLIFLLDKQNVICVNEVFNNLKKQLGIKLYSSIFRIILTDNGSEFFNPLGIEIDYESGKKVCNLFYCEPYSSWQKGCIEKNHTYIRNVFPKGTSFEELSSKKIKRLEDNINNIPRVELGNKTPYEKTKELYPELINKLNCSFILPDNVDLSKKSVTGSNNG